MNAHIFQHVPFEDIGCMVYWLKMSGARVTYTRFFKNETLPRLTGLDLIIVMGGPMSANDESVLPWLHAEKKFIRKAIESGVAVLGICLGAQLIASSLGARVYQNPQKEIGWFPIETTPHVGDAFCFPEKYTVFHWHGETFDLPSNAVRLARSKVCENQAFQVGQNVIGLQFHLEATPETVGALLDNCGSELVPGLYIQTEPELRNADAAVYANINRLMDEVLSYLTMNNIMRLSKKALES